ncbi:MAG: hypothetical protein HY690_20780 [Chloroflexi bacterium]|nr:hypothetical protein [Chloroflexota bacterium]
MANDGATRGGAATLPPGGIPTDGMIPTPPDFPVVWENPDDQRLFWERENMHFADQMSPLNASILQEAMVPGWNAAARYYELPVVGMRGLLINTYVYFGMMPVFASPEELAARARRSEEKFAAVLPRLGVLWAEEWLPEIKQHFAHLEGFDLASATMPALHAHLADALRRFQRLYEIHFLLGFVSALAMGQFEELYRDLFGKDGTFEPFKLLQGFDNKSLETDRAIWELSRKALADSEVRGAFAQGDAARVRAALGVTASGRSFLAALEGFLAEYGKPSDKFGLDTPSWIEDPAPVINALCAYLTQPEHDGAKKLAQLAAERDRLVADARERLKGYPQAVVSRFETLLAAAQIGTVLLEDHQFWQEQPQVYHTRRLLLEFGRRFAGAGLLVAADDVFFLTLDELRQTATDLAAQKTIADRQALVAARRAVRESFRHVAQPPVLGTLPPGPPPDSPFIRAVGKMFGQAELPITAPDILRGSAGSPGKVRGPAKVIRLLSEAEKLRPGDILVAETTMPPWTPLFATAAAVVTDTGGVLSHCAIVAREYRIPAVVGTGRATAIIRDGQIVEVDGDAGEVRISVLP